MTTMDAVSRMSDYERQVWNSLEQHWRRRANRRGLPNWANSTLERTKEAASEVAAKVGAAVPNAVAKPIGHVADAVMEQAARPVVHGVAALLDLVNDWALELNDPKSVEALARKHGHDLETFADLGEFDLKVCDRLLSRNTLTWRSVGALEGGAMGALALVPIAGVPLALTADVLVVQVLSASIASRIAYSYGYDAKDPAEQEFIQRLVRRAFVEQATKAKPLNDAAKATHAIAGRVRWSKKLRADHRLLSALEKLMKHLGPTGARVPVQNVAKVVPAVGVVLGAGVNSAVLGALAAEAQRYCQTRFLCDKYGLPLPQALVQGASDAEGLDAEPSPSGDPDA